MMNENRIDRTIQLLKKHFYANIFFSAILFLLVVFKVIPHFFDSLAISVSVERYALLITIIAIPVSLKLFANRIKKIPRPTEVKRASAMYKAASFLRLYTLNAVTVMHIILFAISRNTNFLWFTVVLLIIFFYCRPSFEELENLTLAPEPEKLPEGENPAVEKELIGEENPAVTDKISKKDDLPETDRISEKGNLSKTGSATKNDKK